MEWAYLRLQGWLAILCRCLLVTYTVKLPLARSSVRLGPENPGSSPIGRLSQPLCLFGGVGRKGLAPSSCTGESIRGVWGTGSGPFPPAAAGQWFGGDRGCGAMMGSGLKSTVPHLSWLCRRLGLDACGSEGSTTRVIGGGLVCVCHL